MIMRWMVFGKVFIQTSCTRFPRDIVMDLVNYIVYPIEAHIHDFCEFLLNLFVDDAVHGGVVILHG